MNFAEEIIHWYHQNKRDLPWRDIQDPYKIWLSEVILQQTRVEQGLPYYQSFTNTFPTVQLLAEADEETVLKLWQGLGYYSRARNLHFAAKQVVNEFQGQFPNSYHDLLTLKGVGEYTAAAIASFAFELPHAVVDGNVFRLLSRYFNIDTPINTGSGKKVFSQLANELLPNEQASDFNQAIMEFGARQCTPNNPNCKECPLQHNCLALANNTIDSLPVKNKTIKQKKLYFDYFFIRYQGHTYLKKRTKKGIWQNLFDFPLLEGESMPEEKFVLENIEKWIKCNHFDVLSVTKPYKHILSHRIIHARFWEISCKTAPQLEDFQKIRIEDLNIPPIPRLIELFLQDKALLASSVISDF